MKRRDIGEYTESAGIHERTRNIEKKRGEIKHDRKYEEKARKRCKNNQTKSGRINIERKKKRKKRTNRKSVSKEKEESEEKEKRYRVSDTDSSTHNLSYTRHGPSVHSLHTRTGTSVL